MISDEEIVKRLKEKESDLIEQLEKVRVAISVFGGQVKDADIAIDDVSGANLEEYDPYASYKEKIIYALKRLNKPAYVTEIVDYLISVGEDASNKEALMKRITHNASKMYREGELLADKRRRQYRYSINLDNLL